MSRLYITAITLAAMALVLTGCPNGEDPSASDPYADIDDGSLATVLFQEAMCEVAWSCPDANADALDSIRFSSASRHVSESECIAHARNLGAENEGGVRSPEWELAREKGRISIQRSYMQECKTALVDALCSTEYDAQLFEDDPDHACNQFFSGTVEEGGYCNQGDECQGNLSCNTVHEDTADECYGVCVETDSVDCGGESCEHDEFCDESTDPQSCTAWLSAGETCDSDDHCDFGLWCHAVEEECTEIEVISEGESCDEYLNLCQAGTYCSSLDEDEPTCRAHSGEGDDCQESEQCTVGLSCHIDDDEDVGQCAPVEEGSACRYSFECPDGTRCDSDTETCEQLADVGEECATRLECKSDYCKHENPGEPGECTARLPNGEECQQDMECESEYCGYPDSGEPGECAEAEDPEEEICYLPGDED